MQLLQSWRLQYRKTSNISRTLLGNKIVDNSDAVGAFLSAPLQLHLHSQLNTWLQWVERRQLREDTRNIWTLGFGAIYTRGFMVIALLTHWSCSLAPSQKGVITFPISWSNKDTAQVVMVSLSCHTFPDIMWYRDVASERPGGATPPGNLPAPTDLARNGNSGCANKILGCAKCLFWQNSSWKWKN